ncbi:MAG: bifunctional demethylmenaquinone methyltransferase/2-methoxy-6-polyprenyl-1,4-benzoquinol methylase UbiE [Marinilabiliales bacterium]|nr:MAG: bifunctional demethylmenaquinone methyltransferase/2-methoxy-6-polyprenyl-1,4-benzoquinol methylase UbiE [Marinilabiliales bacterium]
MSGTIKTHITGKKQDEVTSMFDTIAPKYDRLNRILSFRSDVRWRKKMVKMVKQYKPEHILDLAAGTGDLSLALTRLNPGKIIAADPSAGMLAIAEKKFKRKKRNIEIALATAENLPFDDKTFDLVTIAFGIRNFSKPETALNEIHRVLKKDGILAILEFGLPEKGLFGKLYLWYFKKILPLLGRMISKHYSAYSYLPETVQSYPYGEEFSAFMKENNFENFRIKKLNSGIAYIYLNRNNY